VSDHPSEGMRVWVSWGLLGLLLVGALVVVVVRSQPSNSPAARADRLAHELRCPTCESEAVANSQSPAAVAIRADIRRRIAAGESDGEIRAAVVRSYTQYVLLLPDGRGIGLVVWIVPIAALFVGAAGLALALRRWSRQPRLAATAADEAIVAHARTDE
jgi:cytochrome c-type biogenesis protein CcmH/NrfF